MEVYLLIVIIVIIGTWIFAKAFLGNNKYIINRQYRSKMKKALKISRRGRRIPDKLIDDINNLENKL